MTQDNKQGPKKVSTPNNKQPSAALGIENAATAAETSAAINKYMSLQIPWGVNLKKIVAIITRARGKGDVRLDRQKA